MKPLIYVLGALFLFTAGTASAQEDIIIDSFDNAAWEAEFNAADKDGDGRLSRDEAEAANPNIAAEFDNIDTDKDGYISPEEDKAALKNMD